MPSVSPIVLAIAGVLGLALIGAILVFLRNRRTFRGYEDIADDARAIGRALEHSEIFRDGADLVASGNFHQLPAMVRFSHGEHTPGLYLRLGAPVSFTLWVSGRGTQTEGRVLLRTGIEGFDSRFALRTDHPTQAKMLLDSRAAVTALEQVSCSTKTRFGMGAGALEISEPVIPQVEAGQHVLDHLDALSGLAETLKGMPGAHRVTVGRVEHERSSVVFRVAVTVGLILALAGLGIEVRKITHASAGEDLPRLNPADRLPVGVVPADALQMPGVQKYRLAGPEDFDPPAVTWLRGLGQQPGGRIVGDFSGKGVADDVAYILVGNDGTRRVVFLVNGENRYDVNYSFIGVAARVPKDHMDAINWIGTAPTNVDGDGLLITRKPDDLTSGMILFSSGNHVVTGVPANYQAVSLD